MRIVKHWKADEREEILSGYAKSGLKVAQYCQKRGVAPSTFHTWRRATHKRKSVFKKGFVQVKPVGSLKSTEAMRIETPKGYHLEIPVGTDENWIHGVIKAVKVR